jgi:PIN domain nuclease of toxin-antitoxin system
VKLLLDTHIWIWIHSEPWRLTSEVARSVSDPENELWVSAVSIWELVTLIGKKRISVPDDLNIWIDKSRQDLKFREAAVTWEVARELLFTLVGHRDPADRLLVATARVMDLTLVTADSRLIAAKNVRILANQ